VPAREPGLKPRVGLFVTCLVDLMRPSVGFAALKLLEDAGCVVDAPVQTCCGQPAFNAGDRGTARDLAAAVIAAFSPYDYVAVPSGSCAGTIRVHFPELFADDPDLLPAAQALADKTHELTSFLHDVLGVREVDAAFPGAVTYHDSCSGLRELGVRAQPRRLLRSVKGLELVELSDADVCCGFGGTFAVKYGDISGAIVGEKAKAVAETGAPTVLAGDLGCLLNIAGKLTRDGSAIAVRHVAEVLAGMTDDPPIGRSRAEAAAASPDKAPPARPGGSERSVAPSPR
jgi:L-lactate dehydrogenase complex protein LldE